MKQLAIIGAGQLGSRHLQGLAKLSIPCEITVVDPNLASLEAAQNRFGEMPSNRAINNVRYIQSLSALPDHLDYVIVATTADVRLEVIRELLKGRTVYFMLLEKVLFQRVDEYAQAQVLLNNAKVKAWVNCPRRIFPIYQELCEFFAGDRLHALSAVGGSWGLGCNGIHFIDLFAMLARAEPSELTNAALDSQLIPSKRKNFMEFTGTLRGTIGSAQFDITSFADSAAKLMVTIRGEQRSCIIDESGGTAFLFDGAAWKEERIRVPFLSELGTEVATTILTTGTCGLTTFADSQVYHMELIRCLGAHARVCAGTDADFCPVT